MLEIFIVYDDPILTLIKSNFVCLNADERDLNFVIIVIDWLTELYNTFDARALPEVRSEKWNDVFLEIR